MAYRSLIEKLLEGEDFSREEMKRCMDGIMEGEIPEAGIAGLLCLLQRKGVCAEEIAGAHASIMARATPIQLDEHAVDTCGTGGDRSGTFNISTAAAIIAAGAGAKVAKHGNRSVTSNCGSADVLEALGVPIDLPPAATEKLYARTGFAFLFAPLYHPSMKAVAKIRGELGIRTIFNILGPLLNPARVKRQLVGVFNPSLLDLYADSLLSTGCTHALVVHGETERGQPLDEASISGMTHIVELHGGLSCRHTALPGDFHLPVWPVVQLQGGTREENAGIITAILENRSTAAQRDAALYAAAMTCYVSGIANCIDEGVCMAREAVVNGEAQKKLHEIVDTCRELAAEH